MKNNSKASMQITSIIKKGFFLIIFFSILFSVRVYADSDQGSEKTAIQKMYYDALQTCISDTNNFNTDHVVGVFQTNMNTKDVRNGDWFSAWGGGIEETLGASILQTRPKSAFLENQIQGKYTNGRFQCGAQGNKLLKNATNILGISYEDLACDYSDNHASSGIFYTNSSESYCADAISKDGNIYMSTGREDYFEKVVTDKTFGGNVPGGSLSSLTNLEKYYVYYNTFREVCATGEPHFGDTGLDYQIKTYNPDTKEIEQAGFSQKNSADEKVYTFGGEQKTCQQLADALNSGELLEAYQDKVEETIKNGGTIEDDLPLESACNDADLKGQNWILCSTANNMKDTTSGLFEMVEELLEVETNMYDRSSPTYTLWSTCRDLSNLAMIIILLFIIFSQLTGYGIDNYGIKKMLPRLITMAILINLSFYICQLLVDISNILGESLGNLLNIGGGTGIEFTDILGSLLAVTSGAGAVAGSVASALVVAGGMAVSWPLIIIMAIIFLLIAIVSILSIFITIAARKIIIIMFVGLAPLAFVCYILPNTKGIFKKWADVFKAALIVYPICSAMHGLGYTIRAIIFSNDGKAESFAFAMIGLIASVLPYLIILPLCKKAIAGIGIVGDKLSGIGASVKKGYQQGMSTARSSEAYKNAQEYGRSRMQNARAQKVIDRLQSRPNLSAGQRERLKNAQLAHQKWEANERQRRKYSDPTQVAAIMAAEEAKEYDDDVNARLSLMQNRGITFNDGTTRAYGLNALRARAAELSRQTQYTDEERRELRAISRGLINQSGGTGSMGRLIRDRGMNDDGSVTGNPNGTSRAFLHEMQNVYNNDSTFRKGISTKEAGASYFLEQSGAPTAAGQETFDEFQISHTDYDNEVANRTKTDEIGLNQSGDAFHEYLNRQAPNPNGLDPAISDPNYGIHKANMQRIIDNQELLNSLSVNDRNTIVQRAEQYHVTGRSAQRVEIT